MNLSGAFARTIIRKAIEEHLPTWIGELLELVIRWLLVATPDDIERVCREMPPERAVQLRRMVAALTPGEMTR